MRVPAFVFGGALPAEARSSSRDGYIPLSDWFATFAELAGSTYQMPKLWDWEVNSHSMVSYLAGRDSGSRAAFLHVLLTHARATRVSTPSTCERTMVATSTLGSKHRILSLRRACLTSPIECGREQVRSTASPSALRRGASWGLNCRTSRTRRELFPRYAKTKAEPR